ncbi:OmpA family protein [Bradyrhizobium cenepequi]
MHYEYVTQFGFEKTWVKAESRKTLNELLDARKCRFINIDVAGYTDTKEARHLNLSELRAVAVRSYLLGADVVSHHDEDCWGTQYAIADGRGRSPARQPRHCLDDPLSWHEQRIRSFRKCVCRGLRPCGEARRTH